MIELWVGNNKSWNLNHWLNKFLNNINKGKLRFINVIKFKFLYIYKHHSDIIIGCSNRRDSLWKCCKRSKKGVTKKTSQTGWMHRWRRWWAWNSMRYSWKKLRNKQLRMTDIRRIWRVSRGIRSLLIRVRVVL